MKSLLFFVLFITTNLIASSYSVTPGSTVNVTCEGGSGGSGTCTSVGLSDGSSTPIYTITNSPVTTSGTLTFTLATQTANKVFSSATSGGAAQPTFRTLVANDIPNLSSLNGSLALGSQVSGVLPIANGGTNNSAALSNNRIIISAGGSLGEGGSLSASKAVVTTNANMLETSVATAAQVAALQGLQLSGTRIASLLGGTLTEWNAIAANRALTSDESGMPAASVTSRAQLAALSSLTTSSVVKTDGSGNLTTGQVALATQVSGNLPVANLNSGTGATSSTFWRGDGTWGSAGVTYPLLGDNGTSSAPTFANSTSTGSGMYFPANVSSGTTYRKVGFGVGVTGEVFRVTDFLEGYFASPGILVTGDTVTKGGFYSSNSAGSATAAFGIGVAAANKLQILTHGDQLLRVQESGGTSDRRIQIRAGSADMNTYSGVSLGGTKTINITPVGNVGGGADTLITYTIAGNTATSNGDRFEWEAFGTFGATTTATLSCEYGGTTLISVASIVAVNNDEWRIGGTIVRTGAATQIAHTTLTLDLNSAGAIRSSYTAPTETLANDIVIKCTGTSSAAADNDIVQKVLIIKWYAQNQIS